MYQSWGLTEGKLQESPEENDSEKSESDLKDQINHNIRIFFQIHCQKDKTFVKKYERKNCFILQHHFTISNISEKMRRDIALSCNSIDLSQRPLSQE